MSRNWIASRTCRVAAVLLVVLASLSSQPGRAQGTTRTLTGQVTDRQHEPLRGAIVILQQEGSETITSYITDKNGNFSFKRLSGGLDYKVTATFRGKTCRAKEISHFDSKLDKNIVFVIKLD